MTVEDRMCGVVTCVLVLGSLLGAIPGVLCCTHSHPPILCACAHLLCKPTHASADECAVVSCSCCRCCLPQAYEPAYGARPLRRWLEHTIITDLSRMIISGQLPDNSIVTADADPMSGPLAYSVEAKPLPAGVAANGGLVGQLKRQLEPFGSNALDDDEDDEDLMEA